MLHVGQSSDLSPEDVEDGVLIPTVAVRDPQPFAHASSSRLSMKELLDVRFLSARRREGNASKRSDDSGEGCTNGLSMAWHHCAVSRKEPIRRNSG